MDEQEQSIIDHLMVITGDVESRCVIVVNGTVNGSIKGKELLISENGSVSGDVEAEVLRCSGRIEGNVVTRSLILTETGCQVGTVETKELEVAPGAVLDCALQSGAGKDPGGSGGKSLAKRTGFDLSECIVAFQEEHRSCCMDVSSSERCELFNHIVDLLKKDKPLIKVTGDGGSGKSQLVRKLKEKLSDNYTVLLLEDQVGAVAALVERVAVDLGIDTGELTTQDSKIAAIEEIVTEKRNTDRKIVLLVDDAQLMYPATMEGIIRLLTSAYQEERGEGLLQMILCGTAQMDAQMVATTIEYFEDETNCQLSLEPLNIKDTADYIRYCLQCATKGSESDCASLFQYETIRKIHVASGGNIAAINKLAGRALRSAHADGAVSVAPNFLHDTIV